MPPASPPPSRDWKTRETRNRKWRAPGLAVSQSTVNRWSRGKVQPGYSAVRKLAVAVWRAHPDLARELVEASGNAWAEPAAEAPPPELDDDAETLEALRRAYRNDPGKVREAVEALRWAEGLSGRPEGEGSGSQRHAG